MDFDQPEPARRMTEALRHLVDVLDERQVGFALIGGLAFSFRGRPRYTKDIDLILSLPQITLPGVLSELRTRGFAFDEQQVVQQWVREHMVVLNYRGVRVDWLKPVLPLYQHVLQTARLEQFLGAPIRIASAEGVIITKLIAFRGQDVLDIETLIAANWGNLDVDWIKNEWRTIADETDPRFQRFEELLKQQQEHVQKCGAVPELPPPSGAPDN